MLVVLRSVPDCPHLSATRELLVACLIQEGQSQSFTEVVGDFHSPSVLVDGVDVTGADIDGPAMCLLNRPTAEQIRAALRRGGS